MTQTFDWPYPGSRWWKFDFHTHTPASHDTIPWQNAIGTDDEVTPEKWLFKYMEAGIDCVAITDHNSGAWIDKLKTTYSQLKENPPEGFREIHIFPGVELSVNGGFHLLAIFDINKTTSDIDSLLGAVQYDGTKGDSNGVTQKGAIEVVQSILNASGIPIPAHIEKPKGLLCANSIDTTKAALDAHTLLQVLKHRGILSMERVNQNVLLPGIYREGQAQWSEVVGSDCHTFQGSAIPGSRYAWIKMANPTLDGVRLALLDGNDISLRRWDDADFEPYRLPDHFIEKIEIDAAKFMGNGNSEVLKLSPYFNALIGGRGTGKSTIVHALRLAYKRESELDGFDEKSEPRHTFDQFNHLPLNRFDRGGLRENTQITVTVVREGIRNLIRWRQPEVENTVEEWNGQSWLTSISQAITAERFPLRLFSQGQIAAMAVDNRQGLLTVIDEAANLQPQKQAFDEAKQTYFTLQAELRLLESQLSGREENQRKLIDVNRKILSLENSQYSDALKKYQVTHRQLNAVNAKLEQLVALEQRIRGFVNEIRLDDIVPDIFDPDKDADVLDVLTALNQTINEIKQQISNSADQLHNLTESAKNDSRTKAWQMRVEIQESEYENIKSELAAQGVKDPNEFGVLIKNRQALEELEYEFNGLESDRIELIKRIQEQQNAILVARQEMTSVRNRFLQTHVANNSYVRIEIEPFGYDPQTLERSIRECLDTDRFESDILEMENGRPNNGLIAKLLRGKDRLTALNDIKRKLVETFEDLSGRFQNHLQRKLETQPEFADRIRAWFPEDDLRIQYSRQGDGKEFQPISQGSAGQRAAAILAFLLAFGEDPLVLDQPEDDLDNHLIYDLVVQQIRANKQRRQLIIVTHNPNIVVNGDAEMVGILNFNGQCCVHECGALQEKTVRDEVCRVMEGGRDAFTRRWQRLGKEL